MTTESTFHRAHNDEQHQQQRAATASSMADGALLAENEKELAGASAFVHQSTHSLPSLCPLRIHILCHTGFASGANPTITPVLERVLEEVRTTGVPRYAWPQLRALLVAQLQRAMDQVAATDATAATAFVGWSPTNKNRASERRTNITELLTSFEGCERVVVQVVSYNVCSTRR